MKLAVLWAASLAAVTLSWASDCSRTATGLSPLTAPFIVRYRSQPFGLYPGGFNDNGTNVIPPDHLATGLAAAASIRPRNAAGAVDAAAGKIVLLSLGMSNTTAEFQAFQMLAASSPWVNPRMALVDGAIGSWSADQTVANLDAYWQQVDARLAAAQISRAQVAAAWLKNADAAPSLAFPADADKLAAELQTIVTSARARFPNLAIVYLSSRIYAGYATSNLNPEPFAYQSGFAVRTLIAKQAAGASELSVASGAAPWLAWGPYLWGDGLREREDGLTWACVEFEDDGTHPSIAGRQKVGAMLLDFFLTDPTARPWVTVVRGDGNAAAPVISRVVNSASGGTDFANASVVTIFGTGLAAGTETVSTRPLPRSLGGASVFVGGLPVPLYYASPTQINFVYPATPEGLDIKVVRESAASTPVEVNWTFAAPGVFVGVENRAAARHLDGTVVSPSAPAHRGETLALWVTGFGLRNPISARPDPLPRILIDGKEAQLLYYGVAPGLPGANQINFVVPEDATLGNAVPLVFMLATAPANPATIAIQ
jgi:uncharacterized protein (TIGR03437 family)